jgi:small redox-active disulfide protein 1
VKRKMPVKIEVFYSPTCPYCPAAIKIVRKIEKELPQIEVEEINTFTVKGQLKAIKNGVYAVPTIILNGKERIVGVPSEQELLNLIKKVEGG